MQENTEQERLEKPSLATAVDLQIVRLGQPGASAILRGDNAAFTEVDDYVRSMAWSMARTMYAEPGVGIAAPQIGANVRMVVIDPDWAGDTARPQKPIFMLNPNITWRSEEDSEAVEACLSVPGLQADEVEVTYVDLDGEERTIAAEGWDARVIQHEVDHINGILIMDYLSPLKRDMYARKLKKHARKVIRAFKEAESEHRRQLQARRVERKGGGDVPTEPVQGPEGSGLPGDGGGPGAPGDARLEFNQPEGS
jgi:peptide deformylase